MSHVLGERSRATKKQLHKTSVLPESKEKRERGGGKEKRVRHKEERETQQRKRKA